MTGSQEEIDLSFADFDGPRRPYTALVSSGLESHLLDDARPPAPAISEGVPLPEFSPAYEYVSLRREASPGFVTVHAGAFRYVSIRSGA